MSYDNAYASAFASLAPLQLLLTRGVYVDSPYAIGLRKLTRLSVLLTQASYDTTPSTHMMIPVDLLASGQPPASSSCSNSSLQSQAPPKACRFKAVAIADHKRLDALPFQTFC